jgi:hypothetical protein
VQISGQPVDFRDNSGYYKDNPCTIPPSPVPSLCLEPSTFILEAVLDRIEDEHDLSLIDKVLKEDEDQERLTHDRVKSDLGL